MKSIEAIKIRFEHWYADQHDKSAKEIFDLRMQNDSYSELHVANAFRSFRAGWDNSMIYRIRRG